MATDRAKKMQHISEYLPLIGYYGKRKAVTLHTGSKTIVEQCHEETTNINKIIGRYRRSGVLPANKSQEQYADVSEVHELLDARLQMAAAMNAYENLPKSITDQFNDVNEFLQYVENQEQIIAQPVTEPEPAPEPEPATPDKTPPAE